MSLEASAFERNPPTLPPAWAQFSSGIYRLDGRLLVVLDVGRLLALTRSRLRHGAMAARLPGRR